MPHSRRSDWQMSLTPANVIRPPASASTEDDFAIRISNLSKIYLSQDNRPVRALANVSLTIRPGERVAVLGPSGCGKSSLLRILAGLDEHFDGELRWRQGESNHTGLRCATVFQGDSTLPWMRVEDNIAIGLSGLAVTREEIARRVRHYQALVGLGDFGRAYPYELSGGMKQRVAIARALATEPALLLMDEPLAALDAQTRLVLQKELHQIWKQISSTVVYVTHDVDEAISVTDRLLVMTARPGRVKAILDVPFDRGIAPLDRRQTAEFARLQAAVWGMVAEEVGQTLAGGDRA